MVNLNEKKITDIQIYFFFIYDKKNKGYIKTDKGENIFLYDSLLNSLYYLGIKVKEYEIYDLIKENGFDKDGVIYFKEFIEIIKKYLNIITNEDEMEKYFYILSDGKDYISKDILYKILKEENMDDIDIFFNEISINDSKIYYDKFITFFK